MLENANDYIQLVILKNVFSVERFPNKIKNFTNIVGQEMRGEYETHIVPMLSHACRTYLYHLSTMETNVDFGSFTRLSPPVKIPESAEELRTPIDLPTDRFSAYALPFDVDNTILGFRKQGRIPLAWQSEEIINPESRKLIFLMRHDKFLSNRLIHKLSFSIFYV